jgi:hypothetical protein
MDGFAAVAPGKAAPLSKRFRARNGEGRSRIGTVLNDLFTIAARERYTKSMMLLAILASATAAAPAQWTPAREPVVQATASVRIVPGARISSARIPAEAMVSERKIRGADGVERNARIVEFP